LAILRKRREKDYAKRQNASSTRLTLRPQFTFADERLSIFQFLSARGRGRQSLRELRWTALVVIVESELSMAAPKSLARACSTTTFVSPTLPLQRRLMMRTTMIDPPSSNFA
jgi:hypothetical protein